MQPSCATWPRGGSRPRYQGSGSTLAERLAPFARQPTFIAYEEDPKIAKLQADKILAQKSIIQILYAEQRNLSYTKLMLEDVFLKIHEMKKKDKEHRDQERKTNPELPPINWVLDDKHVKDWKETVVRRLRCMCRHISQALTKSVSTPWLALLGLEVDSAASRECAEVSAAVGQPSSPKMRRRLTHKRSEEYYYGFDAEQRQAWRQAHGEDLREMAEVLFEPEDAQPTSKMMARWKDKHEHVISELTVESYRLATGAVGDVCATVGRNKAKKRKKELNQGAVVRNIGRCATSSRLAQGPRLACVAIQR